MYLSKIIEDAYSLKVIGLIKVSKKVYKVKCQEGFFCLKFIENNNLRAIFDHIESLHLQCFLLALKNKQHQPITIYENKMFYLSKWLSYDNVVVKELKLKFYYECLAYLHTNTFFNYRVSKQFFKQQITDLRAIIDERKGYYDELMSNYELMQYRSPTGWMFVLNYHKIENCLNCAMKLVDEYQNYVCNLDIIRLCLIYNNFNYEHIMMKEGKLISLDHIKINLCIYDIYNMYQKIPELIFDFDVILDSYFCKLKLLKEEKLLLKCLLHVVPLIKIEHDEINNIIMMSRLLYYLDSILSLNKKLSID